MCPAGNFPGASSGHPHVSGSDVDLAGGFYNHLQTTFKRSSGANDRLETVTMDATCPASI